MNTKNYKTSEEDLQVSRTPLPRRPDTDYATNQKDSARESASLENKSKRQTVYIEIKKKVNVLIEK